MADNSRLKEWMDDQRITNKALAELLGITSGGACLLRSGKNSLNTKHLKTLVSTYPNLCVNWIITGSKCQHRTVEEVTEQLRLKDEEITQLKKVMKLQEEMIEMLKKMNPS
ncbi:MAG: hypothetical protein WC865_13705 [Bacteroidales bacterium]